MHEVVKEYYGKTLTGSEDLKTDACCTPDAMPDHIKPILGSIHEEVLGRYYGCGLVVPEAIEGLRILDLGCGAGRDVYALAGLTGENGSVVGVDMTTEQLEVARRHIQYHADAFGYGAPNTEFLQGYIEQLDELGLQDDSFDLIVSNCVLNLCPDKAAVLREAYRLLKSGGEMYFSDVYADRRIPAHLQADPVLYGECLSGALYWSDFLELARAAGFVDARLVEDRPLGIENQTVQDKVADISFYSATWRLFKVPELEAGQEDYGQVATYLGTLPRHPQQFALDKHHPFSSGQATPVSSNTLQIIANSRFAAHFDLDTGSGTHKGPFTTHAQSLPFDRQATPAATGGCC